MFFFSVIILHIIYHEILLELHVDNTAQANKPQPTEEIHEKLSQDPPMEALQTVEDKQEIEETDKIIATINEQVISTSELLFLFVK